MLRILLVLLTVRNSFGNYHYPKCCDSDSVLEKFGSFYDCIDDLDKRTEIVTNRTNFIESGEEGYCVDVESSVSLFKTNGTHLTKVENIDVDFFPKCCPINYFYNSTTHGCVKSQNKLETFFRESFIKVGLPQCKIIIDMPINTFNSLDVFNGSIQFEKTKRPYGEHCVDKDENNLTIVRICHNNYDVCESIRCIHKCCLDGQSFVNGSFCKNTFIHGLDFSAFSGNMDNVNETFAVIHDEYNPYMYPLTPQRFHFHLDANGGFTMTEIDESLGKINVTRHYEVQETSYCIEHAFKEASKTNKHLFFRGFPQQKQLKFIYTGIAMAISCFFLILTILYYSISSEKKSLFGKILISYCTASFFAFLLLSYFGLNINRPVHGSIICKIVAFVLFYLTLSIFTWMNVMCVDIYCTFGSSKSFSSHQMKHKEMKRFLLYSLHGWGTPLLLTVIPLLLYYNDVLPFVIQIIIKEEKCFLYKGDGNYGQFLFSTVPISIVQFCNLILFIKTAMYCWQVKKEISKMNDTHVVSGEKKQNFNKFRDRFGLLMKLFFIMGISYLFEVVSTFYDFKKNEVTAVIEIVWDCINCLQGLFIFVIFIMKKRIFKKFNKKVGLAKLRKISLVSSAMTQTTSLPTLKQAKSEK